MGPHGDAKDLLRPRSRERQGVVRGVDQGAARSASLRMFSFAALIMIGVFAGGTVKAQDREPADPPTVYVISVTGVIDLGLAPYMQRALDLAADAGALGVIIEIDTPGGRLDAVIQMRDSLLNAKVPTVAFIDTTAFSAGALVAIASERIFMAPGAVIGAATPVIGGTGEVADEKTISAVRGLFKSTAERFGRDPLVAAAMVDVTIEIPGVVADGELLTLTVNEALEVGYSDGVVADRTELLSQLGWAQAEIVEVSESLAESLVRLITGSVIAGLLLLLGFILIIGDFVTEGFGLGAALGVAVLGLYFWGHLLAGLAGWEDVALVILGIALVAVKLFVLPGFGVAGIAGFLAIAAGAFLSMTTRNWEFARRDDLWSSGVRVAVTMAVALVALVAILVRVGRRGAPKWLTLTSASPSESRDPKG
jgi:membrane-bound serine protease (ClpP class)